MLRGRDEGPLIIRSPLHVVEAADDEDSQDQESGRRCAALEFGAHGGDCTRGHHQRNPQNAIASRGCRDSPGNRVWKPRTEWSTPRRLTGAGATRPTVSRRSPRLASSPSPRLRGSRSSRGPPRDPVGLSRFPSSGSNAAAGAVERGHRIDQQEAWDRQRFQDVRDTAAALRDEETRNNYGASPFTGHRGHRSDISTVNSRASRFRRELSGPLSRPRARN